MTQRWRQPMDEAERRPLFNGVRDNRMDHPGYNRTSADTPPSVRIGLRVACTPIPPSRPNTSELRRALLRVLGRPVVSTLIADMTHTEGLTWEKRDSRGRHNLGAVLTDGQENVAPPAWARVLLPDPTVSSFGRDPQCADFVLHVEPRARHGEPAPARDLAWWHRCFSSALTVSDTITTHFLTGELGLVTGDEPSSKLAVWLKAPRDLTQLVDITAHDRLPGTYLLPWFDGYAVADADGSGPAVVATEWIRKLCDDALYLDDYEEALLTFGSP